MCRELEAEIPLDTFSPPSNSGLTAAPPTADSQLLPNS
jgi:hypothetical protein